METGSGSGAALALKAEYGSGSPLESKKSSGKPRTLTKEAWRLKKEPWRAHISVLADSYHLHEELYPDQTKALVWYSELP